jgi:hypothetical protein
MKYDPVSTICKVQSKTACVVMFIVAMSFLLVSLVQGQASGAGDAAHFLRNGLGARARGMGGAFVAVANDVTAIQWNPAGISTYSGLRIGGSYENEFGGLLTSQSLGGVYGEEVWGIGGLWFNLDLYSVYFVSAGMVVENWSFGVSGKLYSFAYGAQMARGVGIDVGIMFDSPLDGPELTVGLVSHDIGWSVIRWQGVEDQEEDNVAWVTRLGVAVAGETDFGRLMGTVDLELALPRPPHDDEVNYLSSNAELGLDLGAEVTFQAFAVRTGLVDISFSEEGGLQVHPTLGAGAQILGIEVDAAWMPDALGSTYLLSVEFVF